MNINKFKMFEAMGLSIFSIEVPLNIITTLPHFMKIYQAVQKLLMEDRQPFWNDRGNFNAITTILKKKLHPFQNFKRPPFRKG
jgi:hypothetical protein